MVPTLWDYAVEWCTRITETMLSCGELPKVLSSLRDNVIVKLEENFSGRPPIDMNVHLEATMNEVIVQRNVTFTYKDTLPESSFRMSFKQNPQIRQEVALTLCEQPPS